VETASSTDLDEATNRVLSRKLMTENEQLRDENYSLRDENMRLHAKMTAVGRALRVLREVEAE
jgi:hypothetical protein